MPTDTTHNAPTHNTHTLHAVRQRIAAAMLPPPVSATLGDITLHPHQQDAVARLLEILPLHHGALLADDVGLGKTYVALAVARHYTEVHCLAPAPLCAMWRTAASHAGLRDLQVHSLHAISRTPATPMADGSRALIIIDEAHALRNPNSARYRATATACTGADVLLISATPLHNHPRDLRALFALFAGARADALTDQRLETLIIRRRATDIARTGAHRPDVVRHPSIPMPQDQETLAQLLALPAPLPARDGAVAGALIRLGLLRAWCSSDAALAHALRRRQLRTAALRDVLRSGRHATQAELRSWLVGDDAGQLAFPELLTTQHVATGPLLEVLERHLEALRTLAARHDAIAQGDHQRSDTMRALLGRHDGTPIVAFSQFSATVEALYRALADIAGIAMLTGQRARIASGPVSRMEVLDMFAPSAHGRAPPPPHQRIRLLLTTDLLAEGVNLQDAGVVIHLDLPWTAARRDQRLGRCVRIGSPHRVVHSYRFTGAHEAERHLRAEQLVLRKARLHQHFIGQSGVSNNSPSCSRTHSAAEQSARTRMAFYAILHRWQQPNTRSSAPEAPHRQSRRPIIAEQVADRDGAVLHVEEWTAGDAGAPWRQRSRLMALEPGTRDGEIDRSRRWRHHTAVHALLPLLQASAAADLIAPDTADDTDVAMQAHRRYVRRQLRRGWRAVQRATRARHLVGPPAREQRRSARRLTQLIVECIQQLPPDQRIVLRAVIEAAHRCAQLARGAAADAALHRWAAQRQDRPIDEWLMAWRDEPVLRRTVARASDHPVGAPSPRIRLVLRHVLLLVRRPDAAALR